MGRMNFVRLVASLALAAALVGCDGDSDGFVLPDSGPLMDAGAPDAGPEPVDCFDGRRNGDETDRDCGGSCPACMNGDMCVEGTDCRGGSCIDGTCADPSCTDGVRNADESDVDCGGPDCDPCRADDRCSDDEDCESMRCRGNVCTEPSCTDSITNGFETDEDCGGPDCPRCADGLMCAVDQDCEGNFCRPDMTCAPEFFMDGFEAGSFGTGWTTFAPAWTVSMTSPIAGTFSAQSAPIGNNQSSSLTLTVNCTAAGSINFQYRVSSKACCDGLRFSIDGSQLGDYRGTMSSTIMFPLTAGSHTLLWTYRKDVSGAAGTDNAFIDEVSTPNCTVM